MDDRDTDQPEFDEDGFEAIPDDSDEFKLPEPDSLDLDVLDDEEDGNEEETPPPPPDPRARLVSLNAYRGAVMLLLASAGFGLTAVAAQFKGDAAWDFVARQFSHAPWCGCRFWDLIQPAFMFMVGVAMPFSMAKRRAEGQSFFGLTGHVLKRSLVLIALGIFLSSNWSTRTNFTFVNVLTQIGLAYTFAAVVIGRGAVIQSLAILAVLGGYWYAFFQHPLPPAGFDFVAVGAPENYEAFTGIFAHWNINANFASEFDTWFLNLLPRAERFVFNEGGYQTLNFVPSIATLIFGIMAGQLMRGPRQAKAKLARLAAAGLILMGVGIALNFTVCPIVKRIWTPSWTIFSAGCTTFILAAFYGLIDVAGWRRWTFPLVVVGLNPLTMYVMFQLSKPWIRKTIDIHANSHAGGELFSGPYGPILQSLAVLFAMWLFLLWMYGRRIFVRM